MHQNIGLYLTIAILLIAVGFLLSQLLTKHKKKEEVTSSILESRLSECSDLTTCVLEYTDLVKYSNGTIPFITKKSFSMIYQAVIRAGIDLSKATVEVQPHTITVTLPETKVFSIDVNTDSLRFYDEHFALFNWTEKKDISSAILLARDDAVKHANVDQLKQQARKQAEIVINQLIAPLSGPNREIVIH